MSTEQKHEGDFTLNIPFNVRRGEKLAHQTYGWYIDSPDGRVPDGYYTGDQSGARTKLRAALARHVALALMAAADKFRRKSLVVTGDGHVLLVQYELETWGYNIADKRAARAGGTWGAKTYEEALEWARNHAAQCYGGVAWEVVL